MNEMKLGTALPNGALVVDFKELHRWVEFNVTKSEGIVLALVVDALHPHVTWRYVMDHATGVIETTGGAYRSSVFPAAKDFASRIGTDGE